MDAGLYKLSGDQAGLNAANELIVFNSTLRACAGVTLSAGGFTFASGGPYLCEGTYNFTRTAGTTGYVVTNMCADPLGTPEVYGGSAPTVNACFDNTTTMMGSSGPQVALVQTAQNVTLGPCIALGGSATAFTCNASTTGLLVVNLTGALVSAGLYSITVAQDNIDTAGEQLVWDSQKRACSGVTLSSGAFTFAQSTGGLYVAKATIDGGRSSGTGKTLSWQWTTDPTGSPVAFAVGTASGNVTGDSTADTGGNGPAYAVIDTSGGAITIGTNVLAVAATVFSVNTNSNVVIWRLV